MSQSYLSTFSLPDKRWHNFKENGNWSRATTSTTFSKNLVIKLSFILNYLDYFVGNMIIKLFLWIKIVCYYCIYWWKICVKDMTEKKRVLVMVTVVVLIALFIISIAIRVKYNAIQFTIIREEVSNRNQFLWKFLPCYLIL